MQTSAEFVALATATYSRARVLLDRAAADASWTAALEQEGGNYGNLPPATIMDLDETVLDNSPFQGQLVRNRSDYSAEIWSEWVDLASAAEIPGAVDFVKYARTKGVRVVFVTNRTAQEEAKTIGNLNFLLGNSTLPDDVLSSGENGWPSDKASRRSYVANTHRVLLLIGDDLNDFTSVSSAKKPPDRVAIAKAHASKWNDRWVLIPNPLYGSWERIIYSGLSKDPEVLQRKQDAVRGFKRK